MLLLSEALRALAHGLAVGGIFFYKALWSILFGVSVTAAIDVLVDKERMARFLGGRDLRATGKATMLGAASGVSFGEAVGAIVSDLITVPVLNLWKEFMGWKATAYIFAVFYTAMVVSALAMEYLFKALRALPTRPAASQLLHLQFRVDYTLVVTLLFVAMAGWLYLVSRVGPPVVRKRGLVAVS